MATPTPSPQTIAFDIGESLKLLALSGGNFSAVNQKKTQILDECEKLSKVDAISASLLKAQLFCLLGDRDKAEYWIRNAEKNGASGPALDAREIVLSLMGYATEAYDLFDKVVLNRPRQVLLRHAIGFGWFRKAQALLPKLNEKEVSDEQRRLIVEGNRYLDLLGITESQMCRAMDIALGILRDNELIWLGSLPEFNFVPSEMGGPLLCMTYRIEVTPAQAAELNGRLVNHLVRADLDTLGLIIGYSGTLVPAAPRAEFARL